MASIAILGGGFSGAAAAILLSRHSAVSLDIRIVEPRAAVGMGLAHSTPEPDHRLNGPDTIHSPYPEDPGHFADWMRASGTVETDPDATAATGLVFARRMDFGRYMQNELARHANANSSGSRIDHVPRAALRLTPNGAGVEVELHGGAKLRADRCVLALGWNETAVPGPLAPITGHAGWIADPWNGDHLSDIPVHAPVFMVGAGLTASDTFAALAARGHVGPVLALSRHGLRPASQNPHRSNVPMWDRLLDPDPGILRRVGRPATVREAIRALRQEFDAIDLSRSSWHVPFDEMRDAASHFWPRWTTNEKRRFVRHAKSWYDANRYRNPPQIERIIAAALDQGRLAFAGGRLRSARVARGSIEIEYDVREGGERRVEQAAAVINCTGPRPRPSTSANPLWQTMIADGVARDAPCGLGIEVDGAGRVVDCNGQPQNDVFAVGPPTIGHFGEASAVPYIVRQIIDVARAIGDDLAAGGAGAGDDGV